MEAELKELKSVLRSLVVSSPSQVDVRTLLNDYRSMMGVMVPVAKYGYRNPVEFLRERCSDCFLFSGPSGNPVLTLIVPDTLKHIDNFVKKQKVSVVSKIKGKRRSVPGLKSQPKNCDAISDSFKTFKATKEKTQSIKESHIHIEDTSTTHGIEQSNCETSKRSELVNKNNDASENTKVVSDEIDGASNCSSAALENFLRKRLPQYNSSLNLDTQSHGNEHISSNDDDSGRQTSSSSSSAKMMKLESLKIEIANLIEDHPDGIWCTDFIRLYREKYKKDVNFTWFGYTSILSLLYMLEDLVSVTRPTNNGDWLVCHARAGSCTETRESCALPAPRRATVRPVPLDPEDALPGISYDPDVFPEDCVHFMESVPSMPLQDLEQGMMLEVIIGEVYSPSHFWLIRLGDDYHIAMEDMMDEMTEYYERGAGRHRRVSCGAVRVGHYCASVYEGDWHRALIVQVLDADTVKVRHVDYGTVETCASASLRPLLRRWARLPAQAIRARLAGVSPCAGSRQWPRPAAAHFLHLVRDARLIACLVAVDLVERALRVHLVNTSAENDVHVDVELERAGHADRADEPVHAPWSSQWHLYPRFEALESGAAPSYEEVHRYLRDGIALQYVDAYRRHVPACRTPSPPVSPAALSAGSLAASSVASSVASPAASPAVSQGVSPTASPFASPVHSLNNTAPHQTPSLTVTSLPQSLVRSSQQFSGTSLLHSLAAGEPTLPAPPCPHLFSHNSTMSQPYQKTISYPYGLSFPQSNTPPQEYSYQHPYQSQTPHHYQNTYRQSFAPEFDPVVRLSVAECETFRRLSLEDPAIAHRFMVQAISSALAAVNPQAQLTNTAMPQQFLGSPQPLQVPQPQLRPPPGFER